MTADVLNLKNEKVGTVDLPERVFGVAWNESLVKQVLMSQRANARDPWAHVRERSEVAGSGKKPWRQKGTGRARHGMISSPIWVGGGKAHGPRNDKDYSQKVNKKMKRAALFAVLSRKWKDGEVKVLDTLAPAEPKTKLLAGALHNILNMKKGAKRYDALLVHAAANAMVSRSSSNLQKAKAIDAASLNIYDIMNHANLLLEKESIAVIEKHYKK
ncbi:MAG: 50S ribosomal protein L4 [Minisyncoccia bacterium]